MGKESGRLLVFRISGQQVHMESCLSGISRRGGFL